MRKVTETIASAFKLGRKRAIGNTSTDGVNLHLHGNLIARIDDKGYLDLTLAGWHTPTTRERLNGILQIFGINGGFYQRNYEQYLSTSCPVSIDRHWESVLNDKRTHFLSWQGAGIPKQEFKEPVRLLHYDWIKFYPN